jgi:hypothetical protein
MKIGIGLNALLRWGHGIFEITTIQTIFIEEK